MGRPKLDPATKRAITTLRNKGYEVNVLYAKPVVKPVARAVVATPATPAPVQRTNGYRSKAERAAGLGNACPQCARTDLRYPVHTGSTHEKDVRGSGTWCEIA